MKHLSRAAQTSAVVLLLCSQAHAEEDSARILTPSNGQVIGCGAQAVQWGGTASVGALISPSGKIVAVDGISPAVFDFREEGRWDLWLGNDDARFEVDCTVQAPRLGSIVYPAMGQSIEDLTPVFEWQPAEDDGYIVRYDVEVVTRGTEEVLLRHATSDVFLDPFISGSTLPENMQLTLRVRARDDDGAASRWTESHFLSRGPNDAPELWDIDWGQSDNSLFLSLYGFDPEFDGFVWDVMVEVDGVEHLKVRAPGYPGYTPVVIQVGDADRVMIYAEDQYSKRAFVAEVPIERELAAQAVYAEPAGCAQGGTAASWLWLTILGLRTRLK